MPLFKFKICLSFFLKVITSQNVTTDIRSLKFKKVTFITAQHQMQTRWMFFFILTTCIPSLLCYCNQDNTQFRLTVPQNAEMVSFGSTQFWLFVYVLTGHVLPACWVSYRNLQNALQCFTLCLFPQCLSTFPLTSGLFVVIAIILCFAVVNIYILHSTSIMKPLQAQSC